MTVSPFVLIARSGIILGSLAWITTHFVRSVEPLWACANHQRCNQNATHQTSGDKEGNQRT